MTKGMEIYWYLNVAISHNHNKLKTPCFLGFFV
jgi:hypothetical protein